MNILMALAEQGGQASGIDTAPLINWTIKTIVPIICLGIGILIIGSARKGRLADNANTVLNIMIGAAVISGAGIFFAFSKSITSMILGGS